MLTIRFTLTPIDTVRVDLLTKNGGPMRIGSRHIEAESLEAFLEQWVKFAKKQNCLLDIPENVKSLMPS